VRILHAVAGHEWGGTEHRVLVQSRWLVDNSHHVLIAAPGGSAVAAAAGRLGVPFHAFQFHRPYHPQTVLDLRRLVKGFQADVVDSHGGRDSAAAVFCRDLCSIVCTRHIVRGRPPNIAQRLRLRKGYHHIIVACDAARRRLLADGLAGADRVSLIGEWAEDEFFEAEGADGVSVRRDLGLDVDAFVVGMVGMLRPEKGQEDLIRAVGRVVEGTSRQFAAILIGGPTSKTEAYRERLLTLVRTNRFEQIVHFLGHRDDVARLLPALDLVAVPSHTEAQSRSVPQAFAAGKPVVATDVGGLPELVRPGENGWLVPVGDIDALASAILEAMSRPLEVQRLGKQAHLFARSHLRLEQRMAETLVAYEKALHAARPGMGYVQESARAARL
jgi:glycosyltransferase involved in cell wall biosynthesis